MRIWKAAALLILVLAGGCSDEEPEQVNVLLVVVDTLRADHAGCYGYERNTTPNLDGLAREGVLFENAVSQAAFTLPAMASLFTALNPVSHGVRKHPDEQGRVDALAPGLQTVTKVLKGNGYETAAVVSNSLFQERFKTGFSAGFDFYDVGKKRRDAGPTTDVAIDWLAKGRDKEKPFFLWVHYIDPHWPYDAPEGFEKPFLHDDGGTFRELVSGFHGGRVARDRIYFDNPLDSDGIAAGIAEYDNEVAYADSQLGRLLAWLRQSGLDRNTIVAVVSDHGEALGEHGLTFAHSFFLYDEIQKVVFVIRPPGGRSARRVRHQVRLLDFMPTLFGMLGIDQPAGIEGRDLAPLWTGGEAALPDLPAFAESEPRYPGPGGFRYPLRKRIHMGGNAGKWKMVRHKGYKLIWIPGEGWELYDLKSDRREMRDLSSDPPAEAASLARLMEKYLDEPSTSATAGSGPELDRRTREELREILRSLGY